VGYQPIENYGVVGDLQTVALVGMDGSIDLLSFPWFDSPTVFAALLDDARGGRFRIAPQWDDARPRQLYLPDTNVLLTRFLSSEGVAEVSDFMPVRAQRRRPRLIRRAKTVRGEVHYRMVCEPKFDYATVGHSVDVREGEVLFTPEASNVPALRLRTSVPVRKRGCAVVAEFRLGAGEHASFVLEPVNIVGLSGSGSSIVTPSGFIPTISSHSSGTPSPSVSIPFAAAVCEVWCVNSWA